MLSFFLSIQGPMFFMDLAPIESLALRMLNFLRAVKLDNE
jgi:hypothetical protein